MNKLLLTLPTAALIFMGASCTQNTVSTTETTNTNVSAAVSNQNTNDSMIKDEEKMEKEEGDAMMKDEESDTAAMEKTSGSYVAYDASAVMAAAEEGSAVLFFNASWCPTCKSLSKNISASLSDIPSDVTIFNVDYDNSSELKKKYGVTYQHTLVQVDAEGNLITKWSGGNTLDSVLSRIE